MSQQAAAAPDRTHRVTNIALWALQILTALAVIFIAGLSAFTGAPEAVATFDAIGAGQWFRYLTGALEVAGALGLLIPRLSGLAGLALAALWLVAIATHLFLIGGSPLIPVVFFILTATIAWGRRDRIRTLFPSRA